MVCAVIVHRNFHVSLVRNRIGALHEQVGHECLKSSFAFRKPAMAVVSCHPARTAEGVKASGWLCPVRTEVSDQVGQSHTPLEVPHTQIDCMVGVRKSETVLV